MVKSIPPTLPENGGAAYAVIPSHRESDDNYHDVVAQLAPRWRVIVCKDYLQWIIQKRTAEPLHRGVWRGQSYVTSRSSLIRLCASLELLSDHAARASLGRAARAIQRTVQKVNPRRDDRGRTWRVMCDYRRSIAKRSMRLKR